MTTKERVIAIGANSLVYAITAGLLDYCYHKKSINDSIFSGLIHGVFFSGVCALGCFSEEEQKCHTQSI